MIEQLEGMPPGVLGFQAKGDVEADDYRDVLRPTIDEAIEEHGKIRVLYVLGPEFDEYEGGAMFEDTKLGFSHPLAFERCAVVTDARWAGPALRVFSALWPGIFRAFPLADLEAAKSWLAE
jgi:hypothetical protein